MRQRSNHAVFQRGLSKSQEYRVHLRVTQKIFSACENFSLYNKLQKLSQTLRYHGQYYSGTSTTNEKIITKKQPSLSQSIISVLQQVSVKQISTGQPRRPVMPAQARPHSERSRQLCVHHAVLLSKAAVLKNVP